MGEYKERIKSVLNEVEKSAGDGMDAADLFKPLLARGKLRCIGATTLVEYRKYIETDAALER